MNRTRRMIYDPENIFECSLLQPDDLCDSSMMVTMEDISKVLGTTTLDENEIEKILIEPRLNASGIERLQKAIVEWKQLCELPPHPNLESLMFAIHSSGQKTLAERLRKEYGKRHQVCLYFITKKRMPSLLEEAENIAMLSFERKLKMIEQIASAICFLHSRRVGHGRLEISYISVSRKCDGESWNVKINGHGFWNTRLMAPDFVVHSTINTYCSPEQLSIRSPTDPRLAYDADCIEKFDIYAFGLIAFFIATGIEPWDHLETDRYKRNLAVWDAIFEEMPWTNDAMDKCEPRLLKICLDCIQRDPSSRPTMKEIAQRVKELM
jgi:serine/threonine protein kinase